MNFFSEQGKYVCREYKKAILLISFGTMNREVCEKTYGKIEEEIRVKYSDYEIYHAWTSNIIRERFEQKEGIHVFGVSEIMEKMYEKGILEVFVQPLYVMNGKEIDLIKKTLDFFYEYFDRMIIGSSLLTTQKDIEDIVNIITEKYKTEKNEMLILMGHGTEHFSNSVYLSINHQLDVKGYDDIILGTVKAYPNIEDIKKKVKEKKAGHVVLVPFMLTAGAHAWTDMNGEQETSWKNILKKEGCTVRCVMKGLAEYQEIRELFIKKLEGIMR